jgi:hypothetical protein
VKFQPSLEHVFEMLPRRAAPFGDIGERRLGDLAIRLSREIGGASLLRNQRR